MTERIAEWIWLAVAAYAATGGLVAAVLMGVGLNRLDPSSASPPWRVAIILTPGLVALWPILLLRLLSTASREDRG